MTQLITCTITATFQLVDEGTLYLAALDQLAHENGAEIPDFMMERALKSPESAMQQLVLRGAPFRLFRGLNRRGLPKVEVHSLTAEARPERGADD